MGLNLMEMRKAESGNILTLMSTDLETVVEVRKQIQSHYRLYIYNCNDIRSLFAIYIFNITILFTLEFEFISLYCFGVLNLRCNITELFHHKNVEY